MTPIEMIFESITKITEIPPGFVKNRHYNITDLYGYTVIDDRKGL